MLRAHGLRGELVALSHSDDPQALREATDVILDAITALLADIRQQEPPPTRWNPTTGGVPRYGNPNRRNRRTAR